MRASSSSSRTAPGSVGSFMLLPSPPTDISGTLRHNQGVVSVAAPGRPPITSHARIEQAAFRLFEVQGFTSTTTEQIAHAAGIGRRTLFRYFASKSDIPWGRFDESLAQFRNHLASIPAQLPLGEAIVSAVVDFNTFDEAAWGQHHARMRLIMGTPDLQAHAALKHAQWRSAVAEFVARRTGTEATDLLPVSAGHAALAMAVSAYELWLRTPAQSLPALMRDAGRTLTTMWAQ